MALCIRDNSSLWLHVSSILRALLRRRESTPFLARKTMVRKTASYHRTAFEIDSFRQIYREGEVEDRRGCAFSRGTCAASKRTTCRGLDVIAFWMRVVSCSHLEYGHLNQVLVDSPYRRENRYL